MDRRRKAIVASAVVIAAAVVLALLAVRLWNSPSGRVGIVVRGVQIQACFTIRIVVLDGSTVGTIGPECVMRPSSALNGTYPGNTTWSVPVSIDFLDPGNATCQGLYLARYRIQSGSIQGFSVDTPFAIDRVTPPPAWDVVNFYGERGYIVVRTPNETYDGFVRLTLSGIVNSPDGVPQCP